MEGSTSIYLGSSDSLNASSIRYWDGNQSLLKLGLYWLCIAYVLYTILTNLWNIIDILGAKHMRNWRKTPASLPLGLPLLGHALYFASNMPYFSYSLK